MRSISARDLPYTLPSGQPTFQGGSPGCPQGYKAEGTPQAGLEPRTEEWELGSAEPDELIDFPFNAALQHRITES